MRLNARQSRFASVILAVAFSIVGIFLVGPLCNYADGIQRVLMVKPPASAANSATQAKHKGPVVWKMTFRHDLPSPQTVRGATFAVQMMNAWQPRQMIKADIVISQPHDFRSGTMPPADFRNSCTPLFSVYFKQFDAGPKPSYVPPVFGLAAQRYSCLPAPTIRHVPLA